MTASLTKPSNSSAETNSLPSLRQSLRYKGEISFDGHAVQFIGPIELEDLILEQVQKYGKNPMRWVTIKEAKPYSIFLNIFILKTQNKYDPPYKHEELCHCRLVPAIKVIESICQGNFEVAEISRTTLAGTGCGSCKKDIDDMINYHIK